MTRWILFCALLVSCTRAHDPGYNEVGNGGDFLAVLMEEGRLHAAQIVSRLRPEGLSPWLREHQRAIETDLRKSRHVFVGRLPEGCSRHEGCGCAFKGDDKIYLARERCQQTLRKRHEAAKLLLHESMHHFVGDDETRARTLGVELYEAWTRMGHPDTPHWKLFKNPHYCSRSQSLWNGKELLVWCGTQTHGKAQLTAYDPATGNWRKPVPVEPQDVPEGGHRGPHSILHPLLAGGLPYVFTSEALDLKKFAGDRWISVPRPPLDGFWGQSVIGTEDRIIVWNAGHNYDGKSRATGAIFDTRSQTWRVISERNAPLLRANSTVLWAGGNLFVWGGINHTEHTWDTGRSGGLYNPETDEWTPLKLESDLMPKSFPVLAWTGKEIIVYGGFGIFRQGTYNEGAAYDPKLKRWRIMKKGPAPVYEDNYFTDRARAVWTGTEVLYFQGTRMDAYDPFHDEWLDTGTASSYPEALTLSSPAWTGMEVIFWDPKEAAGYLFYP